MQRFVIIGGGVAGHRAALELSARAPGASISLLCEEDGLPYDRPPLSKELLLGSKEPSGVTLKGASVYSENGIRHYAGVAATAIDRDRRLVLAQGGMVLPYDALLLATGSKPRRLPASIAGNAEIHYLRTLPDCLKLRGKLKAGRHITIIGGGFIGLEVAAGAIARGCQVTVLEMRERVLARGMPVAISQWVQRLHVSQGVDLRLSVEISRISRERGGFWLEGPGWQLQTDLVVAGIGIDPNVELAAACGLAIENGLKVDARCRTSDAHIFAAGEVTCRPVQIGGLQRIESWKVSSDQGAAAARVMAGEDIVFDEIPWLWSDQFDCNIQVVGFPDHASCYETIGQPESRAWTLVCLDSGGTIVGGIAINRGRDASLLKRAIRAEADFSSVLPRIPA
jgi:3-phenylpropionate/trans-cinnamate dioxygenase ferredoxin reductase subunit/anthranilate 1,2-dioxygenase ferredoxin reductase subunit